MVNQGGLGAHPDHTQTQTAQTQTAGVNLGARGLGSGGLSPRYGATQTAEEVWAADADRSASAIAHRSRRGTPRPPGGIRAVLDLSAQTAARKGLGRPVVAGLGLPADVANPTLRRHQEGPRPRMLFEIIKRARLRLAAMIAPPGADVHDPDTSCCYELQALHEDVFYQRLEVRPRDDGTAVWLMDVTTQLRDLATAHAVQMSADGHPLLTSAGEKALARLWGRHRIPPWGSGHFDCHKHGPYDGEPGEFTGCLKCRSERWLNSLRRWPLNGRWSGLW